MTNLPRDGSRTAASDFNRLDRWNLGGGRPHLTGAQPDFLAAIARLRFPEWYLPDRIIPGEDDPDSAHLKAVQRTYAELNASDKAAHRPETADLN